MLNYQFLRQEHEIREEHPPWKNVCPADDVKGSVLVVDDEESIRELVSILLSRIGYALVVAKGGLEGITRCRRENFDFVITDLNMPDGDGWELAGFIKETSPNTMVVLITGENDVRLQADHTPFDAVIFKPFSSRDILRAIHRGSS